MRLTIVALEALPDGALVSEPVDAMLMRRGTVGGRHGALWSRVNRRIGDYAEAHGLGEVFNASPIRAFPQAPDRRLTPDIAFIRADRLPLDGLSDEPLATIPDLVVEIFSANDRLGEIEDMIEMYQRVGVPLIWLFWSRRHAVWVFAVGEPMRELGEGDELDGAAVLPGFRVAVADLFRVGR